MRPNTVEDPRWGAWATAAWSLAILLAFTLIQAVFLGLYLATSMPDGGKSVLEEEALRLRGDGDVIAIATLLTTLFCVPIIVGIVRLKRESRLTDYLPITLPPRPVLVRWLFFTAIFILASDTISLVTGNPVVPEFMKQTYASTDFKPLLWAALVLAAPLFEEILFRGFMLSGFTRSRLGMSGAVLLTSLAWAVIHFQYDWYGIITIFGFGLLLGTARIKTGTLATPLLIHAAANAFATLETIVSL